MNDEVSITDALRNLRRIIDEAIEKIDIWGDGPDKKQKASRRLLQTRRKIDHYLRPRVCQRGSAGSGRRVLSQHEQERLLTGLNESSDHRLRTLVPLVLGTGIRPAEALSLTWRDVNLEGGVLNIDTGAVLCRRIIPISTVLLPVFADHRTWFQQTFGEPKPGHYLFPTLSNPHDHAKTVSRAWRRLILRTGIQCSLCDLRYTFIAQLIATGASSVQIVGLIGQRLETVLRGDMVLADLSKPSS